MVDLICISLMIHDIKHFFVCLFAITISSLVKCLFLIFSLFLIELLLSLFTVEFMVLYVYQLWIIFLIKWFANIFSQSLAFFSFNSLNMVFCRANIFNFDEVQLLYFAMYNVYPHFWPKLTGKKSFVLIF